MTIAPHLGNTGIKRKSSATCSGVAKQAKPYTSGYQHSDRYSRRRKSKSTYGRKASVIRTMAREVAKINRVPQHMSRAARNITVRASAPATFSFPAPQNPITFLPVSWAIPLFQPNGKHPDERFRKSNVVYLTGVRVRFSVRYLHTFRMRMICYSPPSSEGVANFTKVAEDLRLIPVLPRCGAIVKGFELPNRKNGTKPSLCSQLTWLACLAGTTMTRLSLTILRCPKTNFESEAICSYNLA